MGGMGLAADSLAKDYHISREEQDELAVLSHQRAVVAQSKGYFANEIVPIEVKAGSKSKVVNLDEHPRTDATLENLSKLKLSAPNPVFISVLRVISFISAEIFCASR